MLYKESILYLNIFFVLPRVGLEKYTWSFRRPLYKLYRTRVIQNQIIYENVYSHKKLKKIIKFHQDSLKLKFLISVNNLLTILRR